MAAATISLAVVGGRDINDPAQRAWVRDRIGKYVESLGGAGAIDRIVSGGAQGVDTIAAAWAEANGVRVKVLRPDWTSSGRQYNPGAGLARNGDIVSAATHVLALPTPMSIGTWDTIRKARNAVPTRVVTIDVVPTVFGGADPGRIGCDVAPAEIEEVRGDLFAVLAEPADVAPDLGVSAVSAAGPRRVALGHCVASDLGMRAGIAVQFRSRFAGLDELRAQPHAIGDVPALDRDGRRVYYLVTKNESRGKPTLRALRKALAALRAACDADGIGLLCLPQIGCGLDRLDWEVVRGDLAAAFAGSATRVRVYIYP